MLQFAEEPRPLVMLDEHGHPLTAGDNARRFFEASWMHKYNGKYYFSYVFLCFSDSSFGFIIHKIKQNVNLNHIPVILLTAKTREEDNLEGLETGARCV